MKRTTDLVETVAPTDTLDLLEQSAESSEQNGLATLENLRLLWLNGRRLLRFVAIGIVLSILIAFIVPTQYTSTTRLMPPDQQSGFGAAMLAALAGKTGNLASLAGDVLGMKSSGDLFVDILKSRTVGDGIIRKFDLRKVYRKRLWEDTRKRLANRTDISQDRKSGVLTIKVSDADPRRASAIASEYVAQLNLVVIDLNASAAHRERVFLEQRLKEVQEDLEQAEVDFSRFSSKNTALDIKEQGKAMVGAAATLQGQLIAAQSELEGLKQIYTENNVRVQSTEARIAELRKSLKELGGTETLESSGSGSGGTSFYPSIRQLPLLGVTYADLYRRTKVDETIFEVLTEQYELAKVAEAKDVPSVKVLDAPDVPERKSFPPRLLIVVMGALLSLVTGISWIIGQKRWHETNDPAKVFAQEAWHSLSGKFRIYTKREAR